MKELRSHQKGFTLIELMVVIAIISILAAFTAPSFSRHIAKANLVNVQLFSNNLKSQLDQHIMLRSEYPDNGIFNNIISDYSHIEEISSVKNNKVDNLKGEFTVVLNKSVGIPKDKLLRYSRQSTGQWICTTSLDVQISPENCTIEIINP